MMTQRKISQTGSTQAQKHDTDSNGGAKCQIPWIHIKQKQYNNDEFQITYDQNYTRIDCTESYRNACICF